MQGSVAWYNSEKGYGFIRVAGREKDLFFHANDRVDRTWNPQEGDEITFEIGEGKRGPAGVNVALAGSEAPEMDTDSEEDEMDVE